MKGDPWTEAILKFFESEAQKEHARPEREYMSIDLIWWNQYTQIVFALEHESSHKDTNKFLDEEVSHLLDIRAAN